ncbi:MAG: Uma2 family endonuclease [Armatimonadota bacterium]|nr:Uma2 family endonuclease [Armatimonadota bacterium]
MASKLAPAEPTVFPSRFRFSPEMYHQMAQMGLFASKRVELIEGEIVEMSPVGPKHFASSNKTQRLFNRLFGEQYLVRYQGPLALGDSEPEPDIAVVPGDDETYADQHPTSALLVVEFSDTSLEYDRNEKLSLYAKAGIPEYWIVNLQDNTLEVYREPLPVPSLPFGYGYRVRLLFTPDESVAPLFAPEVAIPVREMIVESKRAVP